MCMPQVARSGKGLEAEAEKWVDKKEKGKGQRQRGFWGVDAGRAYPHPTFPLSHRQKTLNPSTNAKCISMS